jgi:hypothetical protein
MNVRERIERLEQHVGVAEGVDELRHHVDVVRRIIETEPDLACACRDAAVVDDNGNLRIDGDVADRLQAAIA